MMAAGQEIIEALRSVQAALNPLSGFLRKGTPITRRYLETVRDQIDAALTKMIVRAAPATGNVVAFPKAKRQIPTGHDDGEQPGLQASANAMLVRLRKAPPSGEPQLSEGRGPSVFKPKWMHWKPDAAIKDGGDGPDAA